MTEYLRTHTHTYTEREKERERERERFPCGGKGGQEKKTKEGTEKKGGGPLNGCLRLVRA